MTLSTLNRSIHFYPVDNMLSTKPYPLKKLVSKALQGFSCVVLNVVLIEYRATTIRNIYEIDRFPANYPHCRMLLISTICNSPTLIFWSCPLSMNTFLLYIVQILKCCTDVRRMTIMPKMPACRVFASFPWLAKQLHAVCEPKWSTRINDETSMSASEAG